MIIKILWGFTECRKEPYSFMTIDTTLPAGDPLRFRKILFLSYKKMTVTCLLETQKYEYLTGEDLDYKPSSVDQAKFDYSPLSKFFNKGLKRRQKWRTLKGLKNIEDKNKEQLKIIGNKTDIKS